MKELTRTIKAIDWDDIDQVQRASQEVLYRLAKDGDLLARQLSAVSARPELLALCEHYDILDKIVIYSDEESGVRVRLHVFLPGYFDRPHNHRWSYTSLILRGSYKHVLFGESAVADTVDPRHLKPTMIRTESVRSMYTLHHSMVHAVTARPYTTSLVLRGPAVKERFLVMDRTTGESWWQYGSLDESQEQRELKRMTKTRLQSTIKAMGSWNIA